MNDEGMNKRSRESDGRRRGRESFGIAKDILGIAKMDGGADAPQQKTGLLTVQQVVRKLSGDQREILANSCNTEATNISP